MGSAKRRADRVAGPVRVAPGEAADVREVLVDDVRDGRHDDRDPRPSAAARRADDEGQVFLVVARPSARRHRSPLGRSSGMVNSNATGQPRVLEVVAMEVDRGVLVRGLAPVGPAAGEVVAGDAARRQVDEAAVTAVARDVANVVGWDVEAEVPGTDEVAAESVEVIGRRPSAREPPLPERAGEDSRTIDAAVEVEASLAISDAGAGEPQVAREGRRAVEPPDAAAFDGSSGHDANRQLPEARAPGVESDRDERPLPAPERGTCRGRVALDDQLERARRRPRPNAPSMPDARDHLAAHAGQRRLHKGSEREARAKPSGQVPAGSTA